MTVTPFISYAPTAKPPNTEASCENELANKEEIMLVKQDALKGLAEVEMGVICLAASVSIDWFRCGDVVGDLYEAITLPTQKCLLPHLAALQSPCSKATIPSFSSRLRISALLSLRIVQRGVCLLLSYNKFSQGGMRE